MSLYGALSSSTSGIRTQSNKIGIISDNIANVNTIGYKRTVGGFETLVTSSGLTSQYSPGGVLAQNRALISRQGLLQGTDNATDIAISGKGFFVVRDGTADDASIFYTRAGSFRQDSLGNFRNSAGFYLQGWPLDREGRLPGETGNTENTNSFNNLSSLELVNVQSATGNAADTTAVEVSANLKASQAIYPGAEANAVMDTNTVNDSLPAKSIIVPGKLGAQTGYTSLSHNVNSISRGDKFSISTGTGLDYTYRYGGFTYGRDVTTATNGDSGQDLLGSPLTLSTTPFSTTNGSNTVTVTAYAHGLTTGDVVTLSGQTAAVAGIPASDFNQSFVVTVLTDNTFTVDVSTDATSTTTGGTTGISVVTRPFSGNILDATSATSRFLASTGTSDFRTEALSFTITTETAGTLTFTYTNGTANTQLRQFNTLTNLAESINSVSSLSARIVNGRIYIGSTDANEAITFANGQSLGTDGPPVQAGIDWIRELGLANVSTGTDRFNSLQSLATLINASAGLSATVNDALTEATLDINVEDPLDTVDFTDLSVSAALTAFTTTTPFTTTSSSNVVTISHPAPHGLSSGDTVLLDVSGFTGHHPTAFTATNVFATTNTSTTVTITQTAHGYGVGDTVYIDPSTLTGWPNGTINGIPMTDFDGVFTVTAVPTANTFSFTVASAATSTGSAGAGTLLATIAYNGIPSTDLNGYFEITVSGPSTYTIVTEHSATTSGGTGASGLIVTPPNNTGSILAELGLVSSLNGGAFSVQTLGPLGPEYDATDSDKSMASGNIQPQYSQNLRIYDSLGSAHDLQISFIKVATNTWAAEVIALEESDLSTSLGDGLLAYGTLSFNGDGTLRSVSTGLANEISISWSNGAIASGITFDWGTEGEAAGSVGATTIGKADGMSQFDAGYKVNFINQNGAAVGQLTSVSVTEDGVVIANFNNGESQALYKIPIADFSNPDELAGSSGNVFSQTSDSGEPNLREAGTGGAGRLQSSTLEASGVDLSEELTDLIVAQRAYQANTKVISTADSLLEVLNNTIR